MKFNNKEEVLDKLVEIASREENIGAVGDIVNVGEYYAVKSQNGKLIYANLDEEKACDELGLDGIESGLIILNKEGNVEFIEYGEMTDENRDDVICIPELEFFIPTEDISKTLITNCGKSVRDNDEIRIIELDTSMSVRYKDTTIIVNF